MRLHNHMHDADCCTWNTASQVQREIQLKNTVKVPESQICNNSEWILAKARQAPKGKAKKANHCSSSFHTFHSKTLARCLRLPGLENNRSKNKQECRNLFRGDAFKVRCQQTHLLGSHLALSDGAAFNGDASKILIFTLFAVSRGVVNTACGATNPQNVPSNGVILYFSSIPPQ